MVCSLIDNDIRHNILTTVMTNVVVDKKYKSTDFAKRPLSIFFLPTSNDVDVFIDVNKTILSVRDTLRDTLMQVALSVLLSMTAN